VAVGGPAPGIEVWGGIECTVNRVHDRWFSQLERSGHDLRPDDIERCAALGIRALRYPVLWERVAPGNPDDRAWTWTDERLPLVRDNGMRVIAGLVHHGSGPRHTSLVDPRFPEGIARFARSVAERYPWIDDYTPVNEPLTTARFSGWYGLWYPHGRDGRVFVQALLAQCRGIVLAMRAIRGVNPRARLVQTEDLGKTYSTDLLAYQADFNNELRWLAWDLLCGRVTHEHPLWEWLCGECGASAADLMWFADHPCPPDLIGANHYITSERFLDERAGRYPACYHGGNSRHRYADIEAARGLAEPTGGLAPLLREAWNRYHIPLAVTESHIDATRDDQLRWLVETWHATVAARNEGVDIRAVTSWALFGSFDWNSLLTRTDGYYEPGAFDIRGPRPRETAVAGMLRQLASGEPPGHPVINEPGWWRRESRFVCRPTRAAQGVETRPAWPTHPAPRTIVISGATGTLGRAFARICDRRGLKFVLLDRRQLDIADAASVERALDRYAPWAMINAAGYVRVDEAERDAPRCYRENTTGPGILAAACARRDVALMVFSSDLVFDGRGSTPYVETDGPAPLNVYGKSKAAAEQSVRKLHPCALIVRSGCFFGPWDDYNYIAAMVAALRVGRTFVTANDVTVSPTYVPDLVNASLDLLVDRERGIWHLTNDHAVTWAEFAERAAERGSLDRALLRPCPSDALGLVAPRPSYSALTSERSTMMPGLDDAIGRYFQDRAPILAG
jgi:dTDP-4-dehydrorhamnose reductase